MFSLFAWVLLFAAVYTSLFYRLKPVIFVPALGVLLLLETWMAALSPDALTLAWVVWTLVSVVMLGTPWRKRLITLPFLSWFRTQQPPLTEAERIALAAGGVWWEKEFFKGSPDWTQLKAIEKPQLTEEEQAFVDNQVHTLCSMLNDWEVAHELSDMPPAVWDYVKQEGFLGLVISKDYGGKGFSAVAHSTIVSMIATRSISAAVSIMVPNSLGPAEFLSHYGTDEQKNYYLPRLARGEEIPCFGLTAPNAGSDATNLSDSGVVCKGHYNGEDIVGIRLNFNKRYITLAPITTLLGVAFQMYDPDHLLGNQEKIGITLALIPSDHPGITVGPRHAPLNLAFMNGILRGEDAFIPLDFIIGGGGNRGLGWKMMMECLAVGRGISLPSLGCGATKFSARMSGAYARIREQFKRPIGDFEGIAEALGRIGGMAYLTEAVRLFSAQAVDAGTRPSVGSAIAKYHLTELARKAVDDAMDIHGGRGIQMGPSNYLGYLYTAIPVCITVEGANILTRNLIIFGQGLMRCHPYLQDEIKAAESPEDSSAQAEFDRLLWSHVGYFMQCTVKTIGYGLTGGRFIRSPEKGHTAQYYRHITRLSNAFALITEVSLLVLGNKLKMKEALSARLGDVMSHLYMSTCVLKYFKDQGSRPEEMPFVDWSVQYCLWRAQTALCDCLDNFPMKWAGRILRYLVFPGGLAFKAPSDDIVQKISACLQEDTPLRDHITNQVFVGNDTKDPAGRVDIAFKRLLGADDLIAKINKAIAEGRIARKTTLSQRVACASELGLLSKAECDRLLEVDALVWDALQVDEFEFSQQDAGSKKSKQSALAE